MDRRKKYTRMVLKQSLLQLLKHKPFSAITVKEVCEVADINRSTFYAHYGDLLELLETIEDEIISDMKDYLVTYNLQEKEDAIRMTEKLIEYFAEKGETLQVLLNQSGKSSFEQKVKQVAEQFMIHEMNFNHTEQLSLYISTFIVSGSVQTMKIWLEDGMKESPKKMAELINRLINHGIHSPK